MLLEKKLSKYFIKPSLVQAHVCLFKYLEQLN